ncbi:hypothetical protein BJX99DRAFT_263141 [Aspergillus californicus]
MDLSSLEGPPMVDTSRFSSRPPRNTNNASVPRIHLDHVQGPVSPVSPVGRNGWRLPPRPASIDIPYRNSKYPETPSAAFWQSFQPTDNTPSISRQYPSRPSSSGINSRISQPSTLSTPSRPPRPYSTSVTTPHHLVWVESEQIWILTTRRSPSNSASTSASASHNYPQSSLSPMFHSIPPVNRAPLSHSRSMDQFTSHDSWGDMDPDDLPPPYEQHVFDQPLGPILPAVTTVSREEVPRVRGSRWAAVGRRVT